MGEDLEATLSAIEQPDRDRRGLERLLERARDALGRRSFGLDGRLMDHGVSGASGS